MPPVKQNVVFVLSAFMCLHGCSRGDSAAIFRLRAECANQARQFEASWRRENGSDFEFLIFQNHYNPTRGHCYVRIHYGNADLNMDVVYDPLEGVDRPPLVLLVGGNDKAAADSKEHLDLAARIRDYMQQEESK